MAEKDKQEAIDETMKTLIGLLEEKNKKEEVKKRNILKDAVAVLLEPKNLTETQLDALKTLLNHTDGLEECPLAVDDAVNNIRGIGLNLKHLLEIVNNANMGGEANSIREIIELTLAKDIRRLNRELAWLSGAYGEEYEEIETSTANTVLGID